MENIFSFREFGWWLSEKNGYVHLASSDQTGPLVSEQNIIQGGLGTVQGPSDAVCGERLPNTKFKRYLHSGLSSYFCEECERTLPVHAILFRVGEIYPAKPDAYKTDVSVENSWQHVIHLRGLLKQARIDLVAADAPASVLQSVEQESIELDGAIARLYERKSSTDHLKDAEKQAFLELLEQSLTFGQFHSRELLPTETALLEKWELISDTAFGLDRAVVLYIQEFGLSDDEVFFSENESRGSELFAERLLDSVASSFIEALCVKAAGNIRVSEWNLEWETLYQGILALGTAWLKTLFEETYRVCENIHVVLREACAGDSFVECCFKRPSYTVSYMDAFLPFKPVFTDSKVFVSVPKTLALLAALWTSEFEMSGDSLVSIACKLLVTGDFESPARAVSAATAVLNC